ncbi:MAG: acyl-CoA dehydrogenase family protein [Gammaproteobacteria bacterium]
MSAIHTVEMTAEERNQALRKCNELADAFRAAGPQHDLENTFPYELADNFRSSGLASLTVPKRFGGWGADIGTFTDCIQILAEGDAACALAFNMHLAVVGFFRGMWDEQAQTKFFSQVCSNAALFDGAYSESRAGVTGIADTVATPTDGGFVINGKKTWGTLSLVADIHTFNACITDEVGNLPEDPAEREAREAMFACPASAKGVRVEKTWDALGMRATGTETVIFDNVFVPAVDLVSPAFRRGLFMNLEWQTLSFASVYLGLARRAFKETCEILKTKNLGMISGASDVPLREMQRVQSGVGQMRVMLDCTSSLIERTCERLISNDRVPSDPPERLAWLEIPKVVATENAVKVVDLGMRLVGGGSYRRGHILERLYRDARSGPFHPLTTDQTLELCGQVALGR